MSDGIADPDTDFADNLKERHWRWRQSNEWQLRNHRQELKNFKTELNPRHCRTSAEVEVYLSVLKIDMEIA